MNSKTSNSGKISSIEEQIKALQEKKKKLEERNLNNLAKVIKKMGADSLPIEILLGSLLETLDAFQQDKDSIKKWQVKGKDFLEADKKSSNRRNSSRSFRKPQQDTPSPAEVNEKDSSIAISSFKASQSAKSR